MLKSHICKQARNTAPRVALRSIAKRGSMILAALGMGLGSVAIVQAADSEDKWDITAPEGLEHDSVDISVTEGSWMNLDVSPDGRLLAFDLLGDIYTMPIAGGAATRIAKGLAYEHQPRFSPDSRRIAFVSDRGGGDNIWLMNVDGSDKRQLSTEDFRLLNQPSWSPDGNFIIAKKHFTTARSLGTGEVWIYHISGGSGVRLVKRPSEQHQKELGEPIFSPDGRSLYYTRNTTPGSTFIYAQDSGSGIFAIERYDMDSGEVARIVSGERGAVRPTPSPDGKLLAFVRRAPEDSENTSALYIKDLASGEERLLYGELDRDVQETWAVTGVYPNMAWTPDSRSIIFWAGGKIRRINADGSGAAEIPFSVSDDRQLIRVVRPQVEVAPATFTTRMPRWAAVSPDGSQVIYESLGRFWTKPTATDSDDDSNGDSDNRPTEWSDGSGRDSGFYLWPSWSRDGQHIVYVHWNDDRLGEIRIARADGSDMRVVSKRPGHYAHPRFSPDGRTVVFEWRASYGLTSKRWTAVSGVYALASDGSGEPKLISQRASRPQFGADSGRLFMIRSGDGEQKLVSSDLDGGRQRTHASGELVNDYRVAPDGQTLAFRQNYEVYVTPLLPGNQAVAVSKQGKALPTIRASEGGADYIHWSDSRLHWSMGAVLYSADKDALFADAPKASDADSKANKRKSRRTNRRSADAEDKPTYTPPSTGLSLAMEVSAAKHRGRIAIVGAKIVTMRDIPNAEGEIANIGGAVEIIERGDILIEDDRIVAIGAHGSLDIPEGTRTVNAAGKVILPGFIDAHAHGAQGEGGLVPQKNWLNIANLAMGTTTIHDPSARAGEIFATAEMQRAGLVLAPRIFSTAEIVYGAKSPYYYAEINSYADALAHVKRLKAQGAMSVKNYNQPRRDQRQMVVRAAQAENMLVVAEGASLYGLDMNLLQDGNSTIEHNVPLAVFYADVLQLWGQSEVNYTPTIVVTYGGLAGDPYWRAHTNVWEHPILSRHAPADILRAATKRRMLANEAAYQDASAAREARKVAAVGREVSIGAHGQQAGLDAHWELWSFVRGGWSPLDALKTATSMPARSLGFERDIGTLEVGKLADLLILDADPTVDIRNSDKIRYVMLGGRLYDSRTMQPAN